MSVKYECRYCHCMIGEFQTVGINEFQLGFHLLTPEERREIVSYDEHGQVTVKLVCEYCIEAIEANPELTLIANPLQ